jgi:hypothetical protein
VYRDISQFEDQTMARGVEGHRFVKDFNDLTEGSLDDPEVTAKAVARGYDYEDAW